MECDACGREAVHHAAYSGTHRCEEHFRRHLEDRVRARVREDGLVPDDATPEAPATWLVGLSGGKDSVVLAQVLAETFERDPRVELVAVTIHEGIEGYRDESLAACEELVADLGIAHETVSYAEAFDVRMDDVAEDDPLGMAPCAYCGVFRRDLLAAAAERHDADLLLTGHNLDDEAQTAVMNYLSGDVEQAARHYDASLGPLEERHAGGTFVPRAKPLRDVPEKEVALYAHLRALPMHHAACPHAEESFRATVRDLLLELEEDHPGTRHGIMAGYEEFAAMAAARYREDDPSVGACEACGAPTDGGTCRKCQLLDAVGGAP